MIQVLREYVEGDMQVTEYTRDGVNVSHVLRVPVASTVEPGEVLPVQPTFEQRVKELEAGMNFILMGGI